MAAMIIVNRRIEEYVAHIQLNRPRELNALNSGLMEELTSELQQMDQDMGVRVIIISGDDRAFAAGADIREMAERSAAEMAKSNSAKSWEVIRNVQKPLIAAVSGFALGGGCELAMLCDLIIASESARFGQPEINIGVMPGAGGTQRLTRAVGKALAMEMVLGGMMITADQAYRAGMVNRVVPTELCLPEAIKLAVHIASMPPVAVRLAKKAVLKSFESGLSEGLEFERKNFCLLFDTEDQKEGMHAFLEKRKPQYRGK
ncbi:MAG TPA: enoyl-CoA hydratase-related protein [Chitinophagaceae bacterium]|nr:enoyl-CoA hydratase-related protein [Chitinophagaceae bacterium]